MSQPVPLPDRLAMRAADADRDAVAQVLNSAFADGRLTAKEHSERIDSAMAAVTFGDLTSLTGDLVPLDRPIQPTVANPVSSRVDSSQQTTIAPVIAVFSGVTRKGSFRLPASVGVFAVFGGAEIDLTDVVLESHTTTINVANVFGGTEIFVPEGIRVHDRTVNLFGGADTDGIDHSDPNAPELIIRGLNLFGGLEIWGPGSPKYTKYLKKRSPKHVA